MTQLSAFDHLALAWYVACWVSYTVIADHTRFRARSVSAAMDHYRADWMRAMLQRDLRVIDTTIMGNILTGVGFFASTTILVIGGLIAALGAADAAIEVLADVPLITTTTRTVWELKVLLVLVIFVFAFFKLAWAFRLYNNCSVLIGAAPPPPVERTIAEAYAGRAGKVLSFAAQHANRGLRAYFFALAALAWFLHPGAFIVVSTWIVMVLFRREFRSRTLRAIGREGAGGLE